MPRTLSSPLLLVALLLLWTAWPAAYGGGLTYVATSGVSMEPGIRSGDLALVRRAGSYGVGDVVAYRSELLDTTVLHRVVASESGRHTLRGDNNDFLDPEQPKTEDLHGRLVLRVPRGGIWLKRITSPPALAAYAFLLLTIGGTAAARTRRQRRKELRTMSSRHRASALRATAALPEGLKPVAVVAAAVGVAGLALSGVAWSQPTTRTVEASTSVESAMTFTYTAQVAKTAAYDGTTVTAPQPVFRALADSVEVGYRYAGPDGRLVVRAELSTSAGWKSTVPLVSPVDVTSGFEGTVVLDLDALEARADAAAEVIGLPASSLAVAVVPTVELDGGGVFAPRLELALDERALTPAGELTARDASSTTGTRTEPARLSAAGRSLDVGTARGAGLVALLGAVLAALGLVAAGRLAGPVAEADRIRRRHGDLVLPVLPMVLPPGRPVVDVPDVESLVTLAERYGLLVLTWSRGGVDTYVVQDESTTYRHRSGDDEPTERAADEQEWTPAAH